MDLEMTLHRTHRSCWWVGALALVGDSFVIAAPAQVDIVELRQTSQSLHDTYAKGKRIGIPRMILLDAEGQLIYGDLGLREDLSRRMHEAYRRNKPIDARVTLSAVLAEVETSDGKRVAVESLPAADLYVVDYWAKWCEPCRIMTRILDGTLNHWDGVHSVWLKVESDPEKVDKESAS
jgi:hypothetical protein